MDDNEEEIVDQEIIDEEEFESDERIHEFIKEIESEKETLPGKSNLTWKPIKFEEVLMPVTLPYFKGSFQPRFRVIPQFIFDDPLLLFEHVYPNFF